MADRDVDFSIVSGSSEEMLLGCLESLHSSLEGMKASWSVTVSCDGYGSGLPGRVRARFPEVTVLQNERRLGAAANHNRVLRTSRARYVWLLSDDLLILPNTIERVIEYMDRPGNARVGVLSPRLLNPDGSVQPSTYSFPSMRQMLLAYSAFRKFPVIDRVSNNAGFNARSAPSAAAMYEQNRTIEVDTLCGACVAVRMKAFNQVGPMTQVDIPGAAETEWHRRFQEQEWKIVYFSAASVIYYGSQTAHAGSRNLYPQSLDGALWFFRARRSSVAYKMFCAILVGMFGVRAALAWIARNKKAARLEGRDTSIAWRGLL